MDKKEGNSEGITQFFNEIAARSTTDTAAEMRSQLLAFTKVRSALSELEARGIQILEPDFVERYELALSKREKPASTLDFVLRKETVELQLEVKRRRDKEIVLLRQDFERYHTVLSNNAKTNEILVVWVDNDLPTLAMKLSTIQRYLSELQGERQAIRSELLQPLVDAVESTFARLMNVWIKPEEISITREPYYDVQKLFGDSLNTKIENLKATSERRRLPDKKMAIESLVDSDIAVLEQIFGEGRAEELSIEKVETKLKKMWGLGQE